MNLLFVALKFLNPPSLPLSFIQAAHSAEMTLRTFVRLGRPGRRRSRAKMAASPGAAPSYGSQIAARIGCADHRVGPPVRLVEPPLNGEPRRFRCFVVRVRGDADEIANDHGRAAEGQP